MLAKGQFSIQIGNEWEKTATDMTELKYHSGSA
jgi:hypothetical protein